MNNIKSILLVGVGGQGTILASKILSEGLVSVGYDVKMSEIHGMSQRGGSVSTQIRYGDKVYSPIIGLGEADVIVAFEKMEALRWVGYLKKGGRMVINNHEIPSVPILMGSVQYPQDIEGALQEKIDILEFKAADLAKELGNPRVMNIVLLGALVKAVNIESVDWDGVIRRNVKKGFEELNVSAFHAGYAIR
ncbi:MAG: indolepyruvate oxidoreductase subunit beta [Clostridiales Family XIII bacterium]|jgi:indolepyruvate ferredoxin oxidoreductase beta subunit|nr:indolepyruvate oxidoreductase subunit beta [Clostridiales Family XIII bacterium]